MSRTCAPSSKSSRRRFAAVLHGRGAGFRKHPAHYRSLHQILYGSCLTLLFGGLILWHYHQYRARGSDEIAYHWLRTVAAAQEAYFLDTSSYLTCDQNDCSLLLPDFKTPPRGLNLRVHAFGGTFAARASHAAGTGKVFMWVGTSGA